MNRCKRTIFGNWNYDNNSCRIHGNSYLNRWKNANDICVIEGYEAYADWDNLLRAATIKKIRISQKIGINIST